MTGPSVDFTVGPGTAYVGAHVLALHAGPIDDGFADLVSHATEIEQLVGSADGWTDVAIVVVDRDAPAIRIACRGDVVVDVAGTVIEGVADWDRRTVEIDPDDVAPISARVGADQPDSGLTHRAVLGVVPASALSTIVGASREPTTDPFDALFGRTEVRTVEGAAVRDAIARRPKQPLGVLVFSTGERVVVDKTTVLGRNPQIPVDLLRDQHDAPRLVTVASPVVSRQHAIVRLDRWHLTIDDLASSNGTRITLPGRRPVDVVPGTPTDLVTGALVDLGGDVSFVVEEVA